MLAHKLRILVLTIRYGGDFFKLRDCFFLQTKIRVPESASMADATRFGYRFFLVQELAKT